MLKLLDRLGLGRPELRAWATYDLANSAYQTTVIATVFPIYFTDVAASGMAPHLTAAQAEALALSRFMWATTIAIFIVAVVAPVLGAIADHSAIKKRLMAIFAGIGIFSCFAMFWITRGDWMFALILFVVGNVGVAGSVVFYESLLPHIARNDELDRVSTAGYAIGYLGGGVLLGVNLLMIMQPGLFGFPDAGVATRVTFVTVGLWWLVFTFPVMLKVPEPRALVGGEREHMSLMDGVRQLLATFRELRRYRQALLFLLAFLIYNDGIQTMIRAATAYGTTIGIDRNAMIAALLLTQFIGVPAAFGFGALAGRIGPKAGVYLGLSVYAVITTLAYFMTNSTHFFMLAILVGLVQGGTQALSRSIFASMIPRQKSSEFFAFFGVFERYAGVLGPAIFAMVVTATGSGRHAIPAVLLFFVAGAALLIPVNVAAGRRDARAAEEAIAATH